MSEPEPTTSTIPSPTKFSISTLTSPSTSSPISHQIPQFPPTAFLQLISQYMSRNPFNQPQSQPQPQSQSQSQSQPHPQLIPSSVSSFPLVHSPINTLASPEMQKKRKRKRKETTEEMIDARESVNEETPSTSTNESKEKDVVQQLLQNALSQAGQMRAERMSSISRKSLSASPSSTQNTDSNDVVKIKTHPLFPVLELFSEKVESAMYDMRSSAFKMDDVEKLFAELETKRVNPKTGDLELDQFVYDSIFVLRLQLAEIARVASLSEDFKSNFSASLRKRVNHETLIGVLGDSDEDGSTSDGETTSRSVGNMGSSSNTTVAMMSTPNGTLSIPLTMPPITHHLSHEMGSPSGKRRRFDFASLDQVETADEI